MSEIEITIDAGIEAALCEHMSAGSAAGCQVGRQRIEAAVRAAAALGGCDDCRIGVRVSDDETIHDINRRFLQHDYPTDVISFPYHLAPPVVEGELVVSLDTAARESVDANWSVAQELLLYIIHGTLHLVGFDDTDDSCRLKMREAEQTVLRNMGAISS